MSRVLLAVWVVVAAGCGGPMDQASPGTDGAEESGDDGANVDLPPPWNHGPECQGIETIPGVRVVANRGAANISIEASRDLISCGVTAQSLCTSSGECYGHPINNIRFPAALEPGVHDLQALAEDGQAELSCSACEYVGICALQGSGGFPPAGTLVIEDVTDQRIRGCIRQAGDICFDVAFDVEFCE